LRCLILIVRLHCCQNLTLPNVPTLYLLPANDFLRLFDTSFQKTQKAAEKRKIRILELLERCARLQLLRVMTAVISQSVCEPVCVRVRVRVR